MVRTLACRRLAAGVAGIGLLAAGLVGPLRSQAASTPAGNTVTVGAVPSGGPISPGFLGLSIEYWAFENYAGPSPATVDPVFEQLIRNLSPDGNAVLRIGGVTTDRTWWPVRGIRQPPGVIYTLTPARLAVAREVAQAIGGRLIMGINFEADSPAVAAGESRAMLSAIGRGRIDAFELGNEPELYGSWAWYRTSSGRSVTGRPASYGVTAFSKDFARIAGAMGTVPLAGPATGSNGWITGLGAFVAGEPRLNVVTVHRYPLQACYFPTGSPRYPTIGQLLSANSSSGLAASVVPFLRLAHAHHRQLRIDEMNNISCGAAPGVSNTFAMALWALDALFADANIGVDGVNMHTYPGADYQLFTVRRTARGWQASVEPEYYGLLMFAQGAPPGSRLLPVSGTTNTGTLRTWATLGPDGQVRVVLINDDTSRAQTISVKLPGAIAAATLTRLQAPGAGATSGVTLGGQSFGAHTSTGLLQGSSASATILPQAGTYRVTLPAATAALLTLS